MLPTPETFLNGFAQIPAQFPFRTGNPVSPRAINGFANVKIRLVQTQKLLNLTNKECCKGNSCIQLPIASSFQVTVEIITVCCIISIPYFTAIQFLNNRWETYMFTFAGWSRLFSFLLIGLVLMIKFTLLSFCYIQLYLFPRILFFNNLTDLIVISQEVIEVLMFLCLGNFIFSILTPSSSLTLIFGF